MKKRLHKRHGLWLAIGVLIGAFIASPLDDLLIAWIGSHWAKRS